MINHAFEISEMPVNNGILARWKHPDPQNPLSITNTKADFMDFHPKITFRVSVAAHPLLAPPPFHLYTCSTFLKGRPCDSKQTLRELAQLSGLHFFGRKQNSV